MEICIPVHLFITVSLLLASVSGRVTRCFENSMCVPNDVCINYSCYEIKTYEENCSFDQECSHLNRKLMCKNGRCDCQANLIWIWSISRCRQPGYCQIEADCPGTDFKCNYTLSRCQKINPMKSRAKKLTRSSSGGSRNASSFLVQMQSMMVAMLLSYWWF